MGESLTAGYRALREGAALLDLSGRGKIRATGEDRARLLHAMTTNHVAQLTPGQGCYAFFLNAQGRILADAHILCLEDHLLLDTEPETRRKIFEHLDKYIIADDVTLEDCTDQTATLAVEGPEAADLLASMGAPLSEAEYGVQVWEDRLVARLNATGCAGYFLFSPAAAKDTLAAALQAAGAVPATPDDWRTARIENGKPRYGEEISESCLPQETRLMHALHFNKGCYLGQEIVERIRSRGHVNRLLHRLAVDTAQAPATGAKVTAADKDVGEVAGAVLSPASGSAIALAFLRSESVRPGVVYEVSGATARLVQD